MQKTILHPDYWVEVPAGEYLLGLSAAQRQRLLVQARSLSPDNRKEIERRLSISSGGPETRSTGRQYGRQSLAVASSDPFYLALTDWGLASTHCNQGQFAMLLPAAAAVWAGEGNPEGAVEMLALAANHSLSPPGWQARWTLLTQLRTDLAAVLGPERYQAVWERGQSLELEAVVANWLIGRE